MSELTRRGIVLAFARDRVSNVALDLFADRTVNL
jgi:hypothetical protein